MKHANLFIFFFLAVFVTMAFKRGKELPMKNNAPLENTIVVDTPKQYIFRLVIPAEKFSTTLDTLDYFFQEFGKSLTVDQANQWRAIATRQIRRLIDNRTLDSIIINIPHKPGK